ncbi:MAG: 3-isopropylmalate dehydratase large subunit [Cyclobacteriaceae bacterium]
MGKTLFEKVWDAHVVHTIDETTDVIYIDRHLVHEVTSPQAFSGVESRGVPVFRPSQTTATPDHNVPTKDQLSPIKEALSRKQVETLEANCKNHDVAYYGLGHENHGVVHIIGPQLGLTKPGMTMVCGDSHTSTHGAFGSIAFGIGTSQVESVLATQCLLLAKPKTMKIQIDGTLQKGVLSKDIVLYVISQLGTGGGAGYFVEFCGTAISSLSMEARMTICNMSIEMGARGGMIAPDETTFDYVKGREYAPEGQEWDAAVAYWNTLPSDADAKFDKELSFKAEDIEPMVTYGTNPGMGVGVSGHIPTLEEVEDNNKVTFQKSLDYMGFAPGDNMIGKKIDWVFLGSCTNGRIEDFRIFADFVKGKQKAPHVNPLIVPGSKGVEIQAKAEGLDKILEEAGFTLREPGCSACLAMNEDKVPKGEYAVATSNRNFEGRQGPGSRTILASPLTVAACAIEGKIVDVRDYL